MASVCRRQVCGSEKRGVRQDLDLWRSKLLQCVGTEKILELLRRTRIFEDLRLFKDYKPASVSNWSFDETCLFCCLRREKVKDHVVALNRRIVESGGKPLLGKDNSNIKRLEWQVEEFLNAVLHRKEYTPRIPDPHIPVVACDTMQQMISQLAAHYTSNSDSQGSPQHNGIMDQSSVKARSITSPTTAATATAATATAAASAQNPVLSKLLMADQEAPLDLSVKRVKTEDVEQDGVLDLSIKKHRNTDCTSPLSPQASFAKPIVPRDSMDLGLTKVKDLQSTSTLEQFMSKLCLHHQRQVVDAFGFLQTEVKAVASTSTLYMSSSPITQKPTAPISSHATVQEHPPIQRFEEPRRAFSVAVILPEVNESASLKIKELVPPEQPLKTEDPSSVASVASVKIGPSVEELNLTDNGDDILSSSDFVGAEIVIRTSDPPKCPTLLIVKNRDSGSLEAKNMTSEIENSDVLHLKTSTNEQSTTTSDSQLQASSSESDIVDMPSSLAQGHSEPKYCAVPRNVSAVHSRGSSSARSCTVLRTSNVITQRKTARKSRKASLALQKDSSGCRVISVPDFTYDVDIVYIDRPITECEVKSRNRLLPRRTARKSTRGYRYIGECWELKTVRTLRKSAEIGSGNFPVTCPMPEMTTAKLITPKHAVAMPDGVPPMEEPFVGNCMETVINHKASDQPAETEVPIDVLESAELVVETSQTGQIQSKEQSSTVLASEQQIDTSVQEEINAGIPTSVDECDVCNVQTEPENPKDSPRNVADIIAPSLEVAPATESLDAPISGVKLAEPETDQSQNVTTEALLNPSSDLDMPKDGGHEADNLNSVDLEDTKNKLCTRDDPQIEATEQIQVQEAPEILVTTCTDVENGSELQMTESSLNSEDGTKSTQENTTRPEMSNLIVEETTAKEQPEESKEKKPIQNTPERSSPKKGAVKNIVSSDRCLRSRVSKGTSEQIPQPEAPIPTEVHVQSDAHEKNKNAQESKQVEETVACQDGQNNLKVSENPKPGNSQKSPVTSQKSPVTSQKSPVTSQKSPVTSQEPAMGVTENIVCTRRKLRMKEAMVKETESDQEKTVLEVSTTKDEAEAKTQGQIVESSNESKDVPEKLQVTPQKSVLESPGRTLRSSERMPLRSSTRQIEQPANKVSSPIKNSVQTPEQMSQRNSSTVEEPVARDLHGSPSGEGHINRPVHIPIRSRDCYNTEQSVHRESSLSPNRSSSDSVARMPLRSRNSGTIDQKLSDLSSDLTKSSTNPNNDSSLASSTSSSEGTGHMPLRSGKTLNSPSKQPNSDTSLAINTSSSESTGHMSQRRGKTSKPPTEQQPNSDISSTSSKSSSENTGYMPRRSGKTSNSLTDQPIRDLSLTSDTSSSGINVQKPQRSGKASNSPTEQPNSDISLTSDTSSSESAGHMPLRSGKTSNPPTEQPISDVSLASDTSSSESTVHKPLKSVKASISPNKQPDSNMSLAICASSSESPGHMSRRSGRTSKPPTEPNSDISLASDTSSSESNVQKPLRSGKASNSTTEQPSSDISSTSSKSSSESTGHMSRRSGKTSNPPTEQQPNSNIGLTCSSKSTGDKPLKSGKTSNSPTDQPSSTTGLTNSTSSSESTSHMPLRSGKMSNPLTEQPNSDISLTSSSGSNKSTGHMPLRSGNASITEHPPNSALPGNASESPGRMSLRRSNISVAENVESLTTPPKVKKTTSLKPQTMSKSPATPSVLDRDQDPNSCSPTLKTAKLLKDQVIKDPPSSALPENSFISVSLPSSAPVRPSPSKFLAVLNGDENQHLISDLNTKFDKMQKGWIQMDKEGQPAPKPKNKGDRLKEIWKSKRRIRKPRSLEQQRFSPVQMLFMKSFDLPSICRWFLKSTETKSLVIVKKVNTRLPSETQLCFHSSSSLPGSSNGVFPSVQAERLKKHLKKFAIASPVKSTPKTKRLIAKALAEGLSASKGKEKQEPSTATRISTKPHSYTGLIQTSPPESHSKVTANTKNPASARILRKYSNIREKMQVQQNKTLKSLKKTKQKEKSKPSVMPKNVSKEMSTSKGQKSAVVKKVKVLAKKATAAKSRVVKAQTTTKSTVSKALKGLKNRGRPPTKKLLPKASKTLNIVTNTKTTSKKEVVAKPDLQKSPQTKTELQKKSPVTKAPESLTSPPIQTTDMKPSSSEDQVLTRSQRKSESAALAQTRSPKTATKRGMEHSPSPSSAKRTRTSK